MRQEGEGLFRGLFRGRSWLVLENIDLRLVSGLNEGKITVVLSIVQRFSPDAFKNLPWI